MTHLLRNDAAVRVRFGGIGGETTVGLEREIALDRKTLDGPLLVRRRRPGDRIRLSAAAGSRSLQDLFVDAKVPRALRAAWPIVATPAAIVWVAGLRAAEGFAAEDQGGEIVKIRLVRDT